MDFQHIIETVGRFMDFAGVAVMVIGAVVSTGSSDAAAVSSAASS
ncbi:hypothetical protein [Pseudarthrobacter sp. SSS035]|nr:hypothetical protein [Pseudarthrobacter sp. SSS035]